ncbi:MAG: sialidase family protein [Planctomycetota bacterium]
MLSSAVLTAVLLGVVAAVEPPGEILVGPNVQVSLAHPDLEHGETTLAADPSDPQRLLGASMVLPAEANKLITVVYASRDGGATWEPTLETGEFETSGDPTLTFDRAGRAYYAIMASETRGSVLDFLKIYRSDDGGLTWQPPSRIPNTVFDYLDREWITADTTGGAFDGRIYVHALGMTRPLDGEEIAGSVNLYRSENGGASFNGPVKRIGPGERYPFATGNAVVLSDGTFVCVFPELKQVRGRGGPLQVMPSTASESNAWLKVIMSTDGGESLSQAVTVADHFLDWKGPAATTSTIPWIAADPGSKPFKDRLYVVWPDRRSGRLEILFAASADKGMSWAAPRVLNDDEPFDADDPSLGPDDFMPVVAVNGEGIVGVMWYDRRAHRDNLGYSVRFTASLDGGDTFLPSVRVSEASHERGSSDQWAIWVRGFPMPQGTHAAAVFLDMFFYSGGHTAGLVSDAAGVFHPFWIDNRTGVSQVWTAAVRVQGVAVPHGSEELAALRDIGAHVTLSYSQSRFDRASGLLSVAARIENTSQLTLASPLKVRVIDLRSALGSLEVTGADNGVAGVGAVWDFTPCLPGNTLAPGEATAPKRLQFKFTQRHPVWQHRSFEDRLVSLELRVLGQLAK